MRSFNALLERKARRRSFLVVVSSLNYISLSFNSILLNLIINVERLNEYLDIYI